MYRYIIFEQNEAYSIISFNRPDVLNALNNAVIEEALDAFNRLSSRTRALVLRGVGGRAFAAGADIAELQERTMWTELDHSIRRELASRLENASFPTIAALNGIALGGGLELALACHLRIASDSALIGLPESRLGILPGNGGTVRLSRIVGQNHALRMILFGERINAQKALEIGLVHWVVPADEFDAQINELILRVIKLAPIATRAILDCVTSAQDLTIKQAIENEHKWLQICLASDDKKEGVSAFLEKRDAQFNIM